MGERGGRRQISGMPGSVPRGKMQRSITPSTYSASLLLKTRLYFEQCTLYASVLSTTIAANGINRVIFAVKILRQHQLL